MRGEALGEVEALAAHLLGLGAIILMVEPGRRQAARGQRGHLGGLAMQTAPGLRALPLVDENQVQGTVLVTEGDRPVAQHAADDIRPPKPWRRRGRRGPYEIQTTVSDQ